MRQTVRIVAAVDFVDIAARRLALCLTRAAISGRGLVALTGGSTAQAVYKTLAGRSELFGSVPWDQLRLFLGDERLVPATDAESNFRRALSLGGGVTPAPFPVDTTLPGWAAAQRYAAVVREALQLDPEGEVTFDFVLLTLGEDGHIASLFPGAEHDNPQRDMFLPTLGGSPPVERISLSASAIRSARHVLVFGCGAGKARAVGRALGERPEASAAAEVLSGCTSVEWILDAAAAYSVSRDQRPD